MADKDEIGNERDATEHFNIQRVLITIALVVLGSALTSSFTWFFLTKLNDVTMSSNSQLVTALEREITYLDRQYTTNCSNGVSLGTNPDDGTITGNVLYPASEVQSDIKVIAVSTKDNTKTYDATVSKDENQATFTVNVPAGSYYIYGTRSGLKDSSGNLWKAYYDQFVLCGMGNTCKDTSKVTLTIQAGKTVSNVTISDWYPTK